ncbi:MAG: lipoyl(octanoyl) transferase LipB [Akkermansiaceae bacterium]
MHVFTRDPTASWHADQEGLNRSRSQKLGCKHLSREADSIEPMNDSDQPEVNTLTERITFSEGLALQDQTVVDILSGKSTEKIILLEHEPVYTIGRLRDQSSLRASASLPHPVFETNRGGQATYHGPGQLVGYPILNLNNRGRDLHLHLRLIEDALITACNELEIKAGRRSGMTGVWVEDRKIASIGVGVRKWISMHGFAINVTRESLPPFLSITPCGLEGVSMSCLQAEASQPIDMPLATKIIASHLQRVFSEH